jgi:polyhydroxyalkanoate synthesis regulator phasin
MIEQLIDRMVLEGKITREEIDGMVADLRSQQPPIQEDITSLKSRQNTTENAIMMIMDITLMGGM